jgi:hypothetical protein
VAAFDRINNRPPEHRAQDIGLHADGAQCPYCGQPISHKQFREIRGRIEAEERARILKVEQTLRDRFARDMAQVHSTKKAEIEKAKRDAAKAAEKAKAEAINAEKTKFFGEKLKLEQQLQEMQRRLQKRTANELGDEGELDLFEELRREFPADQIERIKKGKEGADILHRIISQSSQRCGTIVYDVKNTSRFMSTYLTKLRADQLREGADHAILVTLAFPAGLQQLTVRDGVVIVHPARAIAVAHLLRRQTIQAHALRLGNEARGEKSQKLYEFMISDRAAHLWEEIAQVTNDMLDLDRGEKAAHQKTWVRRAGLIGTVRRMHDDFSSAIDQIIGGTEASI